MRRRFSRRGPAARTATTSSITSAQSGTRRRRRLRAAERGAEGARPRADPRFRAQPHGRRPVPTTPGGSTCWNGASGRRTRASFDIDWDALPHRRHPGVLLPILGRPYGEALQAARSQLKYDPANRQLRGLVFRPQAADQSAALRRDPAHRRRRRAAADDSQQAASCWRSPSDMTAIRARPPIAKQPDLKGSGLRRSTAPPRIIERGLERLSRRPKPARGCCIACSNASIIASPIGASLSRR